MSSKIERLWAPWRGEWIQSQHNSKAGGDYGHADCPFCELPKTEASEETLVLYRDDELFVVLNRFPYNPGHVMVIPRAHTAMPQDLDPAIWAKLARATQLCIDRVKAAIEPTGFNLGMNLGAAGGAGIAEHLHWHVLPRWVGDANFMPLLAEAKAISMHNVTTYRKLRPFFDDFGAALRA
jgi:ATP adenylyltransferase